MHHNTYRERWDFSRIESAHWVTASRTISAWQQWALPVQPGVVTNTKLQTEQWFASAVSQQRWWNIRCCREAWLFMSTALRFRSCQRKNAGKLTTSVSSRNMGCEERCLTTTSRITMALLCHLFNQERASQVVGKDRCVVQWWNSDDTHIKTIVHKQYTKIATQFWSLHGQPALHNHNNQTAIIWPQHATSRSVYTECYTINSRTRQVKLTTEAAQWNELFVTTKTIIQTLKHH